MARVLRFCVRFFLTNQRRMPLPTLPSNLQLRTRPPFLGVTSIGDDEVGRNGLPSAFLLPLLALPIASTPSFPPLSLNGVFILFVGVDGGVVNDDLGEGIASPKDISYI